MVASGTQAGFRTHETFMDIKLPHEAVARTDRVAGYLQEADDGSHVTIQSGCFAVELNRLTSIDTLPGMRMQDRDELYPDILETRQFPFAVMKLHRTTVSSFGSKPQRLSVTGDLTIKDTTRPVTMTVDVETIAGGVQAVGSLSINTRDFTVHVPGDDGDSPIVVDPHVTLEFLLILNPA
jgi:YceI-like domain